MVKQNDMLRQISVYSNLYLWMYWDNDNKIGVICNEMEGASIQEGDILHSGEYEHTRKIEHTPLGKKKTIEEISASTPLPAYAKVLAHYRIYNAYEVTQIIYKRDVKDSYNTCKSIKKGMYYMMQTKRVQHKVEIDPETLEPIEVAQTA